MGCGSVGVVTMNRGRKRGVRGRVKPLCLQCSGRPKEAPWQAFARGQREKGAWRRGAPLALPCLKAFRGPS
jgi:hypothetical protein